MFIFLSKKTVKWKLAGFYIRSLQFPYLHNYSSKKWINYEWPAWGKMTGTYFASIAFVAWIICSLHINNSIQLLIHAWLCETDVKGGAYIDCILLKGPYPPCLRMADRALLAGYHRYMEVNMYDISIYKHLIIYILFW